MGFRRLHFTANEMPKCPTWHIVLKQLKKTRDTIHTTVRLRVVVELYINYHIVPLYTTCLNVIHVGQDPSKIDHLYGMTPYIAKICNALTLRVVD